MDSPFSQINSYMQKLPRSSGKLDGLLIGRLVVSALLLAAVQFMDLLPGLKIVLMLLSVLIAGYDVLLDLVDAVLNHDFFSASAVMVMITVLSFLISTGLEGAVCMILYQLGLVLVNFATDKTRRSALEMLSRSDPDLCDRASLVIGDEKAGETDLQNEISSAATTVLKCLVLLAVAFAVIMPIATSLSVRESIRRAMIILAISLPVSVLASLPLAGIVGISFATRFGVLFNHARVLEKLRLVKTIVIDKNGIFADSQPEFIGVKTDVLDTETFMEFVAHAVYYSDQSFAKAILAAQDREYRLDLISDFKEIPGSGVDVKIGGADVTLAKRELLTERGEAVPYEGKEDNSVYYLMVAGKYIGKVLMSDHRNQQNTRLISDLKKAGVEHCILLTEDSKDEGEQLGMSLNADEVYSEFTDETKLQYLESLERQDTMYLYANSLQAHSNAAIDVRVSKKGKYADALVNPTKLELFPESFGLSRRVREICLENVLFSFVVKAVLLFLALTGNCTVWFAIFLDFVAAIATILNAIRVTKDPLIDLPKV